MKKCPYCAEEIQDDAIYCRWCKHDLTGSNPSDKNKRVASTSKSTQDMEIAEKQKKKRWGVFWRALGFGLLIGGMVFWYRMSQPTQFPQYGITGQFNDAFLGGLSSVFIYGGIYSLIVWIKRAFVEHDPEIPRLSKATGFSSLMFFTLMLMAFTFFMINPLNNEGSTTSIVRTSTPTITTLKATKAKTDSICFIRRKDDNSQIIISGPDVEKPCSSFLNIAPDLFYFVDGPISGEEICEFSDDEYAITVRDIFQDRTSSTRLCSWLKMNQGDALLTQISQLAKYYEDLIVTPTPISTACRLWSDVTLDDIGKEICVYGTVMNAYYDENQKGYFILFSSDPSALYIVKYGNKTYDNLIGNCVQYTGVLGKVWNTPVMSMNIDDSLYQCGASQSNAYTAPTKQKSSYSTPITTPMSQPTIQPTASNPVLDITIKVANHCPERHVVIFEGPVHLKYDVAPGETKEWQGAKGVYSWTVDGVPGYQSPMNLWESVWTLTLCP